MLLIQATVGQVLNSINIDNTYPWCIVAYDALERSPAERIQMIKELGFEKYAYDWRDRHLDDTYTELTLARDNNIQIVSVWLWLNAERDSLNQLSDSNEEIFQIIEKLNLKTTFWLSFNGNYFQGLNQDESLERAIDYVRFIAKKANQLGCQVALYNHSGWFGNPYNQLEVLMALPEYNLSLVYNFHHGHQSIDEFQEMAKVIHPYLSAVNLNGMKKDGKKILTIGKGDHEAQMIHTLIKYGFDGPWGIMGHVEKADAKNILEENLKGLEFLKFM